MCATAQQLELAAPSLKVTLRQLVARQPQIEDLWTYVRVATGKQPTQAERTRTRN
jgi:hypothetical protein